MSTRLNRSQTVSSTLVEQHIRSFEDDGYVILNGILAGQQKTLKEASVRSGELLEECFDLLERNGHISRSSSLSGKTGMGKGILNGFCEIVMRNNGRYEMTYGCDDVLNTIRGSTGKFEADSDDTENECIFDQLEALIGKICFPVNGEESDQTRGFYLMRTSLVIAEPGAGEQAWHVDGGHVDLEKHLPCHCVNVFIPLVNYNSELNGPTEIRPGSQKLTRNLAKQILAAKAKKTLRPPTSPLLTMGDVLIFDYRVLHRGKANNSMNSRPVLVLTYAREWFKDKLNFPKRSIYSKALPDGNR